MIFSNQLCFAHCVYSQTSPFCWVFRLILSFDVLLTLQSQDEKCRHCVQTRGSCKVKLSKPHARLSGTWFRAHTLQDHVIQACRWGEEKHLHCENRVWWKRMTFSLWQLSNANRIPITFTRVEEGAYKWLFVGRGKLYRDVTRGQVTIKGKDFCSVLGLFQVIFPKFLFCISSAKSCKKDQN